MAANLDGLLDQYDKGQLNRRQLLTGLALATGGALAGATTAQAAEPAPLAPAMSINHVHLLVKDVKKSAEFYSFIFGAKPQGDRLPSYLTMSLPGAKPGNGCWITLSNPTGPRPDSPDGGDEGKSGVMTHAAYGTKVPQAEFARIAKEIKKRFPEVKDPRPFHTKDAGDGLYFFDPDGISIQLIQMEHNGELGKY